MNLLLDTHVLLWWLKDDVNLTGLHRSFISNTDNICHVSAATVWEIAIKKGLGKLSIKEGYLLELKKEGFVELPVTWRHTDYTAGLEMFHRDPFDRLLIAQAHLENLILLSVDEEIKKYGIIDVR